MKKYFILSFLLIFLLTFGGISIHASAAGEYYTEGYFKYTISDDSVTIISYFGSESEVVIPDYIAALPVTRIKSSTFAGNKTVTVVTIPDTVTSIDDGLFSDMEQLKKVIVQSESITVKVPEGCIIVEDYPVYVDPTQGSNSNQGGDSDPTQGGESNDGGVGQESTENRIPENETTENNQNNPTDNTGNNATDDKVTESETTESKADEKESTDNKVTESESTESKADEKESTDNKVTESETADNKVIEGNENNSENITEDNKQDIGFEVAGDDVEDGGSSQDKPGITTEDNKLITVDDTGNLIEIDTEGNVTVIDREHKYDISKDGDDNFIITDENNNEVTIAEDGTVEFASDDVTETNTEYQVGNKDEIGKSSKAIISVIIVISVLVSGIGIFMLLRSRGKKQ